VAKPIQLEDLESKLSRVETDIKSMIANGAPQQAIETLSAYREFVLDEIKEFKNANGY
jgi:hypothetical protein